MVKKVLFLVIFCVILVLPAFPDSPPQTAPAPGEVVKSSDTELQEPVILIRTAPKDFKGDKAQVGAKGEILVPQALAKSTVPAQPASLAQPPPGSVLPGAPKKPEEGEESKSGDGGETKSGEGGDSKRAGEMGSARSPSGSSRSKTSSDANTSDDLANMWGGGSALAGGGSPVVAGDLGTASTPTVTPTYYYWPTYYSPPAFPATQLQALLDQTVSDNGVPGIILAIQTPASSWNGTTDQVNIVTTPDQATLTWVGASGKADLGTGQLMTPDTQVRLAGVTKLFTAALIMRLVEETEGFSPAQKLSLDDTVEKWLPASVTSGDQITVAMLLNHTSGLHDHETTPEFLDSLYAYPLLPWTADDILWLINSYPLDFPPGTEYKYCNSGYYLLGMIAEAVSRAVTGSSDTVENMIKTRFFQPLGLSRTALTPDGRKTDPFTRDYCWFGNTLYPTLTDTSDWDLSYDWTSGSGVSTGQDMLTWTRALVGGKVVSADSWQQMITPQTPATDYGYGVQIWQPDSWFGETMYGHYGDSQGVYARWLYYPDSGRTIFIAFNRFDKSTPPQVDAAAVADALLSEVKNILQ